LTLTLRDSECFADMKIRGVLFVLSLAAVVVNHSGASDWPQFLGPTGDAVFHGEALAEEWPPNGPPLIWTAAVGEGYSNPVVSDGRLIICHRIGEELVVDCLDAKTGKPYWAFKHLMLFKDGAYFDNGPRPTPAIRNGKVFVHNTDGYLVCLDLKDGKKNWSHHTRPEFQSSGTWHGSVSSPFVTDNAVILQVGGSNACLVAFAPSTGAVLWKTLNDKASASSPMLASFGGKEQLLIATRSALHGLDAATGKALWSFATRKQTSGNLYAANPVVIGAEILLSGWYELGALLLKVEQGTAQKVWHLDNAISSHYATPIAHEGYVYGFHGHAWESRGPNLRCVELSSGKVMWEQPKTGSGTIVRSGNNLLILTDTGELQLAAANPKEFKIRARFQAAGRTTRNYPAVADGRVYVRGPKKLVCFDLRKPGMAR
jgi:outer membrane protein assembly factor BamB